MEGLAETFAAGRMGDEEVVDFVAAARSLAASTPAAEAIRAATRAYFAATDPVLRQAGGGSVAPRITDASVGLLRGLYEDALGGRLGVAPAAGARAGGGLLRQRAGSVGVGLDDGAEELLYPVMQGMGDPWTWQPADSGAQGLGRTWREVLGLPASFEPLRGCDALYVSPHAGGRTDPLGFPVRLATGYYADPGAGSGLTADTAAGTVQACRAALGEAIRHDNRCLEASSAGSNLCARREVRAIGDRVCNHYDGVGALYLAECDCLRATSRPAESRLYEACEAAVARNKFRVKRWAWERDLTLEDCARLDVTDASRTEWGLPPNPSRISDPVAQNLIARFMSRSYRELDRFAGYPVACFYPPCSDRYASYGYTDVQQVYADLGRCPEVRCSASINVNWVSKDVTIAGNTLEVRCDGGPCLKEGLPLCKNGGRCLPVPGSSDRAVCNCIGTGHKGATCEEPLAEGEEEEALQQVDLGAQIAAQAAAQASSSSSSSRAVVVVGAWAFVGLIGLAVLATLMRVLLGGGRRNAPQV